MAQTHNEALRESLEAVKSGLGTNLDSFDQLSPDVAIRALEVLLQFGCQSQHIGNIIAARNAALEISPHCVGKYLDTAVETLNLDDEWEYRRLLELLRLVNPRKLREYLECGRASVTDDTAEIAKDFAFYDSRYPQARFLFVVDGHQNYDAGLRLLSGIPQALVRNSSVGTINPGALIAIRHSGEEMLQEVEMITFVINAPTDCTEEAARKLPLIPIVGLAKKDIPLGTEVYAIMS